MDLYLLRHGESESTAGLTAELDSHLTELGRRQAEAAAHRLAPVGLDTVFVSPFLRTLETAEPICRQAHLPALVYPDICEYFSPNYPAFQRFSGLTPEEMEHGFPFVSITPEFSCDGAWWPREIENDRLMYDRAVRVRGYLQRRFGDTERHVLVVTHAETVGRLIEAFLDIPPNPENPPWSDNCGISLIRWNNPGPAELSFKNDTSHLDGLASHATR